MSDAREADIPTRVAVRAQILGCQRCGLRSICTQPVPFSGANPSPIVVVGEAPGQTEDREHRPFVGPAGSLLRRCLDAAMADPRDPPDFRFSDQVGYLNVVSCYPNRTPHASEVEACRPNLVSQLRTLSPEYALVVGGVAVSAWWERIRIGDMRGRWWREEGYRERGLRTWMLSTWHPSAVLRSGGLGSRLGREFQQDIQEFVSVMSGHHRPGLNVDCVKEGREQGRAELWERNIGVCRKHAEIAGIGKVEGATGKRGGRTTSASSATTKQRTRANTGRGSATSRRVVGESSTRGTLW